VHCPKVFIDWFILLVSLVLKLFVSSRPFKLEGVLCIYVLLSIKDNLKTICMFFLMIWTHVWLSLFHFHDLLFVLICMFTTWLLSFLLSRLYLSCPCFKFFWSQLTNAYIYDQDCEVHVTSKIISFVITYLLEDKQELSLGMLDTSPIYL
jgi:hypothetical protein